MKFITNNSNCDILEISKENLSEWKAHATLTDEDKNFLDTLSDNEIILNFSKVIGFGTAGLRGKMLPGPANMNCEIIALATRALAETVIEANGEKMGVVIACDSRNNSEIYSRISASVLAAAGVQAYIFDSLRPTPELSFAIRHLGCKAGINVTASHNTKEYNGYKVYWEDGAQLPPTEAKKVADKFTTIDPWAIEKMDFDEGVSKGKIIVVSNNVDEAYLENVVSQSPVPELIKEHGKDINILYSPLHGAGYKLVPKALETLGFKSVKSVPSQEIPDGNFPTLERPNPQFISAFNEAIKMSDGYDLIIATDPDADRMGIALKNKDGNFEVLTGNQIALVLIDYIIKAKNKTCTMPKNPAMVKSIVSSKLASVMAEKNGIKMFDVYTGFKYIGEKIKEFEETGDYTFLFGFEESYGYLTGTYARDKDAVVASILAAEAALAAKLEGKTLFDVLDSIYDEYGYWGEYWDEANITAPNFSEVMSDIMKKLREEPMSEIAGLEVVEVSDYSASTTRNIITGETHAIPLPSENMLTYNLSDNSSITVRPSGTEPKIKLYFFVSSQSKEESLKKLDCFKNAFKF